MNWRGPSSSLAVCRFAGNPKTFTSQGAMQLRHKKSSCMAGELSPKTIAARAAGWKDALQMASSRFRRGHGDKARGKSKQYSRKLGGIGDCCRWPPFPDGAQKSAAIFGVRQRNHRIGGCAGVRLYHRAAARPGLLPLIRKIAQIQPAQRPTRERIS